MLTAATRAITDACIVDAVLAVLPRVRAIYLYGSQARGEQRPGSDIDIAVLLPAGESLKDRFELLGELALRLGGDIDLVELRSASDVLRREVIATGRVLYTVDPDEVPIWEGEALTRYGYYRHEVRELLDDFQRTGIAYRR